MIALGVCVGEGDLSTVFNGACDVENSFPVVWVEEDARDIDLRDVGIYS